MLSGRRRKGRFDRGKFINSLIPSDVSGVNINEIKFRKVITKNIDSILCGMILMGLRMENFIDLKTEREREHELTILAGVRRRQ